MPSVLQSFYFFSRMAEPILTKIGMKYRRVEGVKIVQIKGLGHLGCHNGKNGGSFANVKKIILLVNYKWQRFDILYAAF